MNREIYRVSVDHVYSDYSHLNLLEETDDGITKLGLAEGYDFDKKTDNELVQTKEKVDSCGPNNSEHSTIKGKGLIFPENIVESLDEQCSMLYYCMTSGLGDYDTTTIPLKAPLFYQEEDTQIYVTSDDVSKLLRGAWANISLIHVYILYLIEEHISLFQKTKIKFLCPQKISAAEIKKYFLEVQMHLKNAFLTELRKKDAQCKFILAPYMEEPYNVYRSHLKGNAFKATVTTHKNGGVFGKTYSLQRRRIR